VTNLNKILLPKRYTTLGEFIKDVDPKSELNFLLNPPLTGKELAIQSFNKHKHILYDKPL